MVSAEFLFDFGSPNAYLSDFVVPGIEERTGVRFRYIPVLLGGIFKATNNQAPMLAFAPIKGKMEYERLEMMRFIEKHKIPFQMNPHFPVNTVTLMRGAIAADREGVAPAYRKAVFHAMWIEPQNMADPEVLAAVLAAAGLPAARILALTQEQGVKDELAKNTQEAVERGVFGIPSFFVGKELFFGKDRLGQVEDEIRAQRAA